ncbi:MULTISPECIES: glycosyltransferase [unclassified Rhodococcus (in: high G+C Gram-positive bacteria)]|uniref:glycosyltransferase n=1 Tax=unclassified Rhodococcus (in: high G+C Gram-positive bacteria) TaxID=192944 RepID=UPI000B9C37C7|nr:MULTISPECIES: glycosyltransferase [unclassified Rhodococcus (in: high G+C Gram-positive bacteria)]OZE34084.1 glycosyl transferase [Rhodococcus sp. 05-2254-4]OZE51282.1 glycosyl transferase [Rhodococcus sp. 05-2254-3]OZE52933.1 glycosyl transferase [Rhodococcus sp. 05-2254-2]
MSKSVAIIGTRGYPSYYGGFETLIRRLGPYLAEAGWDVTVYGRPGAVKTDDPLLDPRVSSVMTKGLETKSLSTLSYGLTSSLSAARRKPDVALIMNVANGYWLPLLRSRGIPTVVNVDGIEWERAKWGTNAKRVFRGGARLTARYASELVCDSHEIRRRWQHGFGRDGVFIPYGGDTPDPLPVVDGLKSREYVLIVARFVPENTVPEFLEAARELGKKWNVVIVGSSGYGGELDLAAGKLAEESPRVQWLGHVSDDKKLFSLWQHAGAYFHGHSVGGTNPALVQAMACGAPVVARDTVYNKEVLSGAGTFVQPDPASIEATVSRAMTDRAWQDSSAALSYQRAQELYTWEGVCSGYASLLEDVATPAMTHRDKLVNRVGGS